MSQLLNHRSLFCIAVFLLLFVSINSAGAVVSVGYTGNLGTYNCDGVNDEVQIQQALNAANSGADKTVYLKGPHTYWIDGPLVMYSGTKLTGDSSAEIKLVANAAWARNFLKGGSYYTYPIIRNANTNTAGSAGWEIYGFTIDGNSGSQSGVTPGSGGYYTLLWFDSCYNVNVHDMRLEWSTNDALKVYGPSSTIGSTDMNIVMDDCDVYNVGHEAGYFLYCNGVEFTDNTVYTRVNGAARFTGGINCIASGNTVYTNPTSGSTGPAFELDNTGSSSITFNNIDIYENYIYDMRGAAVWMFQEATTTSHIASDIHIHHNVIRNVGNLASSSYSDSAFVICRFDDVLIENNVIDDGGDGIVKVYKWENSPTVTGTSFDVIVRNNIMMYTNGDPGAALWNTQPASHTITATYNIIYANDAVTYGSGITQSNNLFTDPGVYSRSTYDYHLKSRGGRYYNGGWVNDASDSIGIDAGYPSSTYTTEPAPNGGRINIGRYGNTAQASKTYTTGGSAPTGTFSASPDTITLGQSSTLTWTSSGATSASISGYGSVSPVAGGSVSVSPTTTTLYTLSLSNTYGTTTYSDTVTVSGTANVTEIEDTRIKNTEATTNFHSLTYLDLGNLDDERTYRNLIRFDLSEVSGFTVYDSALRLWWYYPPYSRDEDTIIEIYKPSKAWVHDEATWNNYDTSHAWANAGGDWVDANDDAQGNVPIASVTVPASSLPGTGEWVYFDVTNLVDSYVDSTNYGFLIKAKTESNNYIAFASSEADDNEPYLNLILLPVTISSFTPVDTTPQINTGSSQEFTINCNNNDGTTRWYVNGTLVDTQTNHNFEYTYTGLVAGYYNVTAITHGDQQTWILQVGSGTPTNKVINSYTPTSLTPSVNIGTTQIFTVTMSSSDVINWYRDSVLVDTSAADLTSTYSYTPSVADTYNITAIGQNESNTWLLTALQPAFTVTSSTPNTLIISYTKEDQTFTVNTNLNANISWYLEDVLIEEDTETTSGSLLYTPLSSGTYIVRAEAVSTVTNESESIEWTWGVRGDDDGDGNVTTGGTNDEKFGRIKVNLIDDIDASMRLSGIVIVITESLAIIALIAGVWQRKIKVQTAAMAIMILVIGGVAIHVGLTIIEELVATW